MRSYDGRIRGNSENCVEDAESESQLKASNDLVNGHLYKKVKEQQDILTDILSEIEVNLDYPEHDIEYETKANIKDKLNHVLKEIQGLVVTEKNGKFIRQGIKKCETLLLLALA